MKKSLAVTLDDLQATAKDDRNGQCKYRKLVVRYIDARNCYSYEHDGWQCTPEFARNLLAGYAANK